MKKVILTILCVLGIGVYAQGERIEATSCKVTVYTDNGAYVKAKSTNPETYHCDITYTEQYTKDGKTVEAETSYSFNIDANEEKQLFYSQNGVIKITFVKCQPVASDSQGQTPTRVSGRRR
jgi:hypothetical protein